MSGKIRFHVFSYFYLTTYGKLYNDFMQRIIQKLFFQLYERFNKCSDVSLVTFSDQPHKIVLVYCTN